MSIQTSGRLLVFFPREWDAARAEREYQKHWGPDLVRDEYGWSMVCKTRRGLVLVAGLADQRADFSGLGLKWEQQRAYEQVGNDCNRLRREHEAERN
jgi:hypothetical protein